MQAESIMAPGHDIILVALRLADIVTCVQGFRNADEVKRFGDLIDELCFIVATKHSGSLQGNLLSAASVCTSAVAHCASIMPPSQMLEKVMMPFSEDA